MGVVLELKPVYYNALLGRIPQGTKVRTAMIEAVRPAEPEAPFVVTCDEDVAVKIRAFADVYCPEAVPGIETAIQCARSPRS